MKTRKSVNKFSETVVFSELVDRLECESRELSVEKDPSSSVYQDLPPPIPTFKKPKMGICMSKNVVDVHYGHTATVMTTTSPKFLKKRESDMNILVSSDPMVFDSDESKFEREKVMVVICPNVDPSENSKIILIDVDYYSKSYSNVISELTIPTTDDEMMFGGWIRSASKLDDINILVRSQLVVPCFHSSRVYIIGIDNHALKIAKCIEGNEAFDKNLQCPLNACSWPSKGGPTVISMCGDRLKRARGDLCVLHFEYKRIVSRTDRDHAVFGGFLSLQPSQKIMVTAEFGDPGKLMTAFLEEDSGKSDDLQQHSYGHSLNIWDEKLKLKQTIRLEDEGALGLSCVRFLHNTECNHGYTCSPFGNCVFHIHKKSVNDEYVADKVIQYPHAKVEGWIKSEMPAMPLDMVISMDDRFLFISCYLHGFIDQYNISDPFRITPCSRLFIGGGIHRSLGVKLQRINTIDFEPTRRFLRNVEFEGGPARLQLSLDGRRLYVTNSFYTPWDTTLFPKLKM
ncbi:hypothetical protein FO519_006778 [Halicephalobus sp. NKZ332]|nr:hypothetical protein FO519_006778 [Halicephalobus sp. NKZ332]